jgi:hypothetical protein
MTRCPFCNTQDAYNTGYHVECVNERCKHFSKKWSATVRKDDSSLWTPPAIQSHQKAGLMPYREPAQQAPPNRGSLCTCVPEVLHAIEGHRDECPVRKVANPAEVERDYVAERGVLRPVGPKIELPHGHGGLRAIKGEAGRFYDSYRNREVEASELRPGDYFDQIHLGAGGLTSQPDGSLFMGQEHVFFRDILGKGRGYSQQKPTLYTNLNLQGRISYGEQAMLRSATIRLINGESGEPLSADDKRVGWLGENGFVRFEINRLLSVEGQLYRFLPGIALIDEPFICGDHEIFGSLKIGRAKSSFPSTVVSLVIDALVIRATTKG